MGVFTLIGIDLRVGAFEIYRAENAGSPVSGTGHEDGVKIVFLDEAIEMNVSEAQGGAGSPVAEQALLDLIRLQRFAEQWILTEVDHSGGKVVARAPVS